MTLSLYKLEKILSSKGMISKKIFIMNGLCVYLEVIIINNADSFMLYIPSKYEIKVDKSDGVYKIKYIDIDENGTIPEDYAENPDNFDLEKQYDKINFEFTSGKNNGDIQSHLEEDYNHEVSLKDISKTDKNQLREIFRQLRRLKLCVQNLKYKLCILYKYYMCCIHRDNTFNFILVKNLTGLPERKLIVTIDLENFYKKIDEVSIHVKTIREAVYNILDKNQNKHIQNLQKILEQKNNLTVFSENINTKKDETLEYLIKLENLLLDLTETEKKNIEKIIEIQNHYKENTTGTGISGLHSDIERTHQISKYESELSRINLLKQELIRNIITVKSKYENLALKTDILVFDNIVMIDAILKNFISLSEI